MRGAPIAAAALVGLLAAPAWGARPPMVVAAMTPGRDGSAQAEILLTNRSTADALRTATLSPDLFRAVVKAGVVRVERVERLTDTREPVWVALAFDRSASFDRHIASAAAHAHGFIDALPGNVTHVISVSSFGVGASVGRETSSAADAHKLVDEAARTASQPLTRLKSTIGDLVQQASSRQPMPQGLRHVVVFTDGGEESTAYDVKQLSARARELGVQVHFVVYGASTQRGAGFATHRDELTQLAQATGGIDVQGDGSSAAKTALSEVAQSALGAYRLTLGFCDVPAVPPNRDDFITFEVAQGAGVGVRSDWVTFNQQAAGRALRACAAAADTPATVTPDMQPPAETPSFWKRGGLWIAVAAGGLLAVAGLGAGVYMVVRGRAGRAASGSAALPPPAAVYEKPPPTVPDAPALANPFATLPETRLVVVRGLPPEHRYYRISTSPFRVGADPSNHLAIDNPHVSAYHATFELHEDGSIDVIDASRNGTLVDGVRIAPGERVRVRSGQRIEFSRWIEVRLEQPGARPDAAVMAPPAREEPLDARSPSPPQSAAVPGDRGWTAEPGPGRKKDTVVGPPKPWRNDR